MTDRIRLTDDEAARLWEAVDSGAGEQASRDAPQRREQLDRLWGAFLTAATRVRPFDLVTTRQRRTLVRQLPETPKWQLGGRVAAAGTVVASGATKDVQLRWRLNELDNGDLEGLFTSSSEDFAEAELVMNTEPVRRVVLTRVFGRAWMGRFVIPREEWARQQGRLIGRITFADGQVITADEGVLE